MGSNFQINIDKPKADFESHLTILNNERIIFSGAFGTGKTFFLKEYFNENNKYEVLHLTPVNYSIASNQDILELLKYDIGFELLKKDLDFNKIDIDKSLTLQFFILNKSKDIVYRFIEASFKIGKSTYPILEPLNLLFKKYKALEIEYEEYNKTSQIDEESWLRSFLEKFNKQTGNIYEEDNITNLIRNLVNQLKNKGKETILLIDDLDRIDPEHIFRLFNVFSAHFDSYGNKFDFDKVILVCDIENIRNIFHAKYGTRVDFSGYIDKFYSQEIYVFDNNKMISDFIIELFNSMKSSFPQNSFFNLTNKALQSSKDLFVILKIMILVGALNLRSLKKLYKINYQFDYNEIIFFRDKEVTVKQLNGVMILDFLKYVLGSEIALLNALDKCIDKIGNYNVGNVFDKESIETLVVILDINKHLFNFGEIDYDFFCGLNNKTVINYKVRKKNNFIVSEIHRISNSENNSENQMTFYFNLLKDTCVRLSQIRLLTNNAQH